MSCRIDCFIKCINLLLSHLSVVTIHKDIMKIIGFGPHFPLFCEGQLLLSIPEEMNAYYIYDQEEAIIYQPFGLDLNIITIRYCKPIEFVGVCLSREVIGTV